MIDAYSIEMLTRELQADRLADAEAARVRQHIQPHTPQQVRKSTLALAMLAIASVTLVAGPAPAQMSQPVAATP